MVFAWFRYNIWCMDMAYVDEVAKENKGVIYLLVCQDLFDGTKNAKGLKTKDSQETIRDLLTRITKKNWLKEKGSPKDQNLPKSWKKICKAGKKQCYTTTIETKAAFPERTIGSLKKYFAVIWKILATNTIINHLNTSRQWIPEKIARYTWYQRTWRVSNFCPFCSASHYKIIENTNLNLETVFASRRVTFRKGYQP